MVRIVISNSYLKDYPLILRTRGAIFTSSTNCVPISEWILMPENTVIVKCYRILLNHLRIWFEQVLEILLPIFPVVEFFWSCTFHENWIFFGYGVAISWNETISKSISFKGQNNQQENSFRVYHDFEKTKILSAAGSYLLQKCPYHFWVTRSKSLLKVLKAQSARTIYKL